MYSDKGSSKGARNGILPPLTQANNTVKGTGRNV